MPRLRHVLPFLAFALLAAGDAAAQSAGGTPAPRWAADEAEIRSRLTESAAGWNRADLQAHLAIYVDSVTFMTRNGPRPGVDAIAAQFTGTFFENGRPKQQLRFEQVVVRRLDDDAALQTGRFILSGGAMPDQTGWFTLVWVRTADGWRAVHDHSG